jgi:hypothetical protein
MKARFTVLVPVALVLASCPTPPLPAGSLADPVTLVATQSSQADDGVVVFIAEGDGQDLRAFLPGANPRIYVRGPNAISALSIPLAVSAPAVSGAKALSLESFRPARLSSAPINTSGTFPGAVLVVGTAPRIATVDAQSFTANISLTDQINCSNNVTSVSCLPAQALDVVAPALSQGTQPAQPGYVLLAPDTTGAQSILTLKATVTAGNITTDLDLASAPIVLPVGHYWARMTISGDLSTLYLADPTPGTTEGVLEVNVTSGTSPVGTTTAIATEGPVRVAVPNPDLRPAIGLPPGAILLALLTDGRIQTLDTCLVPVNAPPSCPTTPGTALDGLGTPLVPTEFTVPAMDIAFPSCSSTGCSVLVSPNSSQTEAGLAFVALADGTVATIFPTNENVTPKIFTVLYSSTAGSTPVLSAGSFSDPSAGTVSTPVTMVAPSPGQTGGISGITRDEVISAVYEGPLPDFQGRAASLSGPNATPTLTDTAGLTATNLLTPPIVGDLVRISPLGTDCPQMGQAILTITALSAATGTATLSTPTPLPCVPARVAYDILAGAVAQPSDGGTYGTVPAWQPDTAYAVGDTVVSGGSTYICTVAGTSASTNPDAGLADFKGGPSIGLPINIAGSSAVGVPAAGGTPIIDGTVTWEFVATGGPWVVTGTMSGFVGRAVTNPPQWQSGFAYVVGDTVENSYIAQIPLPDGGSTTFQNTGNFLCISAGTSSVAPGSNSMTAFPVGPVVDGTLEWVYLGNGSFVGNGTQFAYPVPCTTANMPVEAPGGGDGGVPCSLEADGGTEDGGAACATGFCAVSCEDGGYCPPPANTAVTDGTCAYTAVEPPGGCVGGGGAFSFNIYQSGAGQNPQDPGANISLATGSQLVPFIMESQTSSPSGLAISLAPVPNPQLLYVIVEGADSLTEIDYSAYSDTSSVNDYR